MPKSTFIPYHSYEFEITGEHAIERSVLSHLEIAMESMDDTQLDVILRIVTYGGDKRTVIRANALERGLHTAHLRCARAAADIHYAISYGGEVHFD